ncbi:hypothetical protein [Tepidibacter formicigenes]|jgi:hypothetical protein|uniref:Uncharacterized protein n=1 Tax=Tepidibacter formicigenes DSM 15518 TaxID=1123349 RepID=A0A1M6RPK9_9FIRM|nr:hypothetical protein [Tepidibacter formicigenes]SHK34451.1 hypothetical protein SAMN02744037_02157 [Tepidibacter formicigenes DSM 15518]
MKNTDIISNFLMFNEISKKINNANSRDKENLVLLEQLVEHYIENYGKKGNCLLRKLSLIKDNN